MIKPDLKEDQDVLIQCAIDILQSRLKIPGEYLDQYELMSKFLILKYSNFYREVFSVTFLDQKFRLIDHCAMFFGTISHCTLHSRPIVAMGLQLNASYVVIAHNHPSGDLGYSEDDINTTKELAKALALVDMQLLDHIIIGHRGTQSLKHEGVI